MKLEFKNETNKELNIKEILKNHYHFSSRFITKLKTQNMLYINNTSASINDVLNPNDTLTIDLDFEEESDNIVGTKMDLNILYEDEFLLIVNKPYNMPVHPSMLHFEDSLSNGIKYYYDSIGLKSKIRPVNRLDKDTTGIVIFAKYAFVQDILSTQMKSSDFEKKYLALCVGNFDPNTGEINLPITRKQNSIIERCVNLDSTLQKEQAITKYKTLKIYDCDESLNGFSKLSLVEFTLITGRTHQIRVHSSYLGHPLLGESLYGNYTSLAINLANTINIDRQLLHCHELTFLHPITNKKMHIISPIPNDMQTTIDLLKKHI